MTEIVSVKFRTSGKNYSFSPEGKQYSIGDKVIVETSKGLEMGECSRGNHAVEDTAVVQPLRPVIRAATAQDLKTAEQNAQKEKDAFVICRKKIAEHGLDMKLVGVECSFDGSKTLFFFTSDGRVDFRELVKDLAGIFHNRIELRQIGVRDEAKLIGGIGICGRPYCCGQFLEDFAPVSTKMAKVQSLSLNPAKISGSCGRLMCCLRYEEEAYEDLVKKVPKVGAFVETADGYGVCQQVNLLRQCVKVSLDGDSEGSLRAYKASEVAAVPGGRPVNGEPYPHVLNPAAPEEEEAPAHEEDPWATPELFAEPEKPEEPAAEGPAGEPSEEKTDKRRSGRRRGRRFGARGHEDRREKESSDSEDKPAEKRPEKNREKAEKPAGKSSEKSGSRPAEKGGNKPAGNKPKAEKPAPAALQASEKAEGGENKAAQKKKRYGRRFYRPKSGGKKPGAQAEN